MAKGVNKAILLGNLGAAPEVRYTNNDRAMARLRLATSESWRDRNTGEKQEQTEWHTVVAFGKLAEICKDYLHKGSQVYIEGRIQTRKWQDKEGNDRYSTDIIANEMTLLGGRATEGAAPPGDYGDAADRERPRERPRPASAPPAAAAPPAAHQSSGNPLDAGAGDSEFDDDIPF